MSQYTIKDEYDSEPSSQFEITEWLEKGMPLLYPSPIFNIQDCAQIHVLSGLGDDTSF